MLFVSLSSPLLHSRRAVFVLSATWRVTLDFAETDTRRTTQADPEHRVFSLLIPQAF